jgi:hypothetical protein
MFERDLPFRALALWCAVVPTALGLAVVVASWVLPSIIALQLGGIAGLGRIPVEWFGCAHAPNWIDPVRDASKYNAVDACSVVLAIPCAVLFAIRAQRLWEYLVLKKLRWVTQEQLERFNNKQQYM